MKGRREFTIKVSWLICRAKKYLLWRIYFKINFSNFLRACWSTVSSDGMICLNSHRGKLIFFLGTGSIFQMIRLSLKIEIISRAQKRLTAWALHGKFQLENLFTFYQLVNSTVIGFSQTMPQKISQGQCCCQDRLLNAAYHTQSCVR